MSLLNTGAKGRFGRKFTSAVERYCEFMNIKLSVICPSRPLIIMRRGKAKSDRVLKSMVLNNPATCKYARVRVSAGFNEERNYVNFPGTNARPTSLIICLLRDFTVILQALNHFVEDLYHHLFLLCCSHNAIPIHHSPRSCSAPWRGNLEYRRAMIPVPWSVSERAVTSQWSS